ncbi:Sodium-dependent phosphate transporter 2 [Trichinella pseudospiralis]|uniref:Phosphate transporter n=1 Tax=Trichinella pseudospiralis TaxID=6337 RepID=A0A0V1JQT3_TRIPS|nr:Sodium-dependent phosphate transporter 2 [Trichinella pseudospiralis]
MIQYMPNWQSSLDWILYAAFVVAFFVAFGMGANDCANSYGTVVGAKVLKLWQAYILATIFETLGAGLLGYRVTETMRKNLVNVESYSVYSVFDAEKNAYKLVDPSLCSMLERNMTAVSTCTNYTSAEFMLGELGVLTGTAAWLLIATIFHAPVSTTHSAVGATIGFALVIKGIRGANFMQLLHIVISWLASPALAGFFSVVIYLIIKSTVFSKENPFDSSLRMLPMFYFATLSVNLFSITYGGSKYLKLDTLSWWLCLLISCLLSFVVALYMHFFGRKLIRARILAKYEKRECALQEGISGCDDISNEKTGIMLDEGENEIILKDAMPTDDIEVGNDAPSSQNHAKELHTIMHKVQKLKKLHEHLPEDPLAQEVFNYLQILSACFLSFSHGSNDTAYCNLFIKMDQHFINAVGPLVAIWCTIKEGRANVDVASNGILEGLILFGAASMIIGLWSLGHRVINTIGTKLTEVTSPSGFAMELGTAFTVLTASKLGIPISTTHCAVGAVVCVGWMRTSSAGVSWKTFGNIAIAWLVTLPVSGSIAALASFLLIRYGI